jgi:hypothetical protein
MNICQTGLKVCEEGNSNNCKTLNFNEWVTISVAVDQSTCEANGLVLSCRDGTPFGDLGIEDPDDLNIRIILGGILGMPNLPEPIKVDTIQSENQNLDNPSSMLRLKNE